MRSLRLIALSASLLAMAFPAVGRAAFAGANGRIVFDRTLTSGADQTFSIAPDGSGATNLSNDPSASDTTPVYSRDGTLIAFARSGAGGAIWVMNADGSGKHQVSAPGAGVGDTNPAFSPDGQQLVFERDTSGSGPELLFVVNTNGTGEHQLLTPPAGFYDETPTWSPDGRTIAFMREPTDDSGGTIMRANVDGSGVVTPVSHTPAGYKDGDPNFSPDGSKIVFSRSQAVELDVASNIIVVDLATSTETPLTNDTASTLENEDPAFSPDGRQIAYGHADGTTNTKQLFLMAADGSGKHAITPAVANQFDGVPNWQPIVHVLSVAKAGSGSGTVTSSPSAINCGSACSAQFPAGQTVTLTATPAQGSTFTGWSGAGCSGQNSCAVAMSSDQVVTATFTANAPVLSQFKVRPSKASIGGKRVKNRCVKPTKSNRQQKSCRRSVKLTVVYSLSTPSRVAFKLSRSVPGRKVKGKCVRQTNKNKKRKRCIALIPVRVSITGPGAAGVNRFSLDARRLGPGSYTLTATPTAAGGTGAPRSVRFTIKS